MVENETLDKMSIGLKELVSKVLSRLSYFCVDTDSIESSLEKLGSCDVTNVLSFLGGEK